MIETIRIIVIIIALLYFLGYGCATVFLPTKLKIDSFFLIPWIGIIFTITLSAVLSMARVPIQSMHFIVFFAAALLCIYSIILKKRTILPNKEALLISLLVVLTLLVQVYSYSRTASLKGTSSIFTSQPNIYINSVEYLKDHVTWGIEESKEEKLNTVLAQDLIKDRHLWGSPLLLGFFTSVFSRNSYGIFLSLTIALFTLILPLLYIFAKKISGKSHFTLPIIIFCLFIINPVFQFLILENNLAYIIFTGIFGFTVITIFSYISERYKTALNINNYDMFIALALSSLSLTYPEGFILILGIVMLICGLRWVIDKNIYYLTTAAKISILAVILNPFTFGTALFNRIGFVPLLSNPSLNLITGRLNFLVDSVIMSLAFIGIVLIALSIEQVASYLAIILRYSKQRKKITLLKKGQQESHFRTAFFHVLRIEKITQMRGSKMASFLIHFLPVTIGYIGINFIFNQYLFWSELIFDRSKIGAVYGEVLAYEWSLEHFYKALISGHNPFGITNAMLYPFGLPMGLVDAGNGIFFVILRPFLSTHQAFSALIIMYLFLANIGMYLLLRRLQFDKRISFVLGAAFGFMTFLMPRGGHLNYWCHYVFPWFYLCVITLFTSQKKVIKMLSTLCAVIFFVLTLWSNFYYFIVLLISIVTLLLYFFIARRELFIKNFRKYWIYILLWIICTFILLIPWLSALYEQFQFEQVPKTTGWNGAIEFSSDLFNYFIPSGYNYILTKLPILLKPIGHFLLLYKPESRAIFENFTYPGVIILISYFILILIYKRLPYQMRQSIIPFLVVSMTIFIFTLGPFLHVFGHWTLSIENGIKIVVPLPYIILHYMPFLNNIRAPGRLVVGFIFFSYVIVAYVLNYILRSASIRTKNIVFVVLLFVFFIDHRYYVNPSGPPITTYPNAIYSEIKNDPEHITVLEIPFTVRDGFTYFGDIGGFQMMIGEAMHGKPVLGGYTGRIPDYKKAYYINNPFLGYIGRVIDSGIQNNQSFDKNNLSEWQIINKEKSRDTLDFLDTKYVVMNDQKPYTSSLSAVLRDIGFTYKNSDHNFSLWERKVLQKEFLSIDMKESTGSSNLGFGWYNQENDFRWSEKHSEVIFKIKNQRKMTLHFTAASFGKAQWVTIYLDKKPIKKIYISPRFNEYILPLPTSLNIGLRFFYFNFDSSSRPANILPNNMDTREISAKFERIWLTDE